jgi:hypothetical protein
LYLFLNRNQLINYGIIKSRKKTIVWKGEESAPKRCRKEALESVMPESTKTRVKRQFILMELNQTHP